ncbi:type I-E CRISPR-associated endonuclease Cas1e [Fontivita pretiosa]|uniref:type I-E CRISPR-associated endonuclease Cas1e n=1 Tax=Fontivita pretiosa TaxID=2989684 RepID=UPI003D175DB3
MPPRQVNLQELPRFDDKLTYFYAEHAVVDQEDRALAVHRADTTVSVPVAALAVLILGPGTSITHAAIKTAADNNCLLIWAGEHAVRFYAQGTGGTRSSRNLLRQAQLVCNPFTRLQVVVRMYRMRFDEPIDESLTLQQLRGKEGARVRDAYAKAAAAHGIDWHGRTWNRNQWDASDPVNRALSAANACLYGLCHAAILAAGYSPALGFIHTGKQLSFVYDIADLYKVDFIIPLAFSIAKQNPTDLDRAVRLACRDRFREGKLNQRILPDIAQLLDVPPGEDQQQDAYADDAAAPADWWTPPGIGADVPIGQILAMKPGTITGGS